MRRRIGSGLVALFFVGTLVGCAAPQPETYRLDDARDEVKALQESELAAPVTAEIEDAASLLVTAELALDQGKPEEAQQIAELALLRVEYARTLARRKQLDATAKQLEEQLEALAQEIDAHRKRLGEARAELDALGTETATEGVPAE